MTPGPGIARTPLPSGFAAGGINCGVRRYRPDLGIIISDREAVAAGVFTQNECKAAPVLYSQRVLPSAHIHAIITNSGQANAATGPQGREDNWKMALSAANSVGCLPHQVLTASTGVIGVPMNVEAITQAIPELVEQAGDVAEPFATAILTTDLVPKTVTTVVQLSKGATRITGICKGSGMIHPNMATTLGYLLTDAQLTVPQADAWLREAVDVSFNMISVDGDTSTNDSVFLMANGATEVPVETAEDIAAFKKALTEIAQCMAQAVARDGEGATKLIEVRLKGAPNVGLARKAARGVTLSPLVKTAIHGEDPNWGRILARLGAEQIPGDCLDRMTLELQGVRIFENGTPVLFNRDAIRSSLRKHTIFIDVDFGSGESTATAWGCDLSKKYIEINAEYAT